MSFKRLTLAAAIAALPFATQAADTALSEVVIKAAKEDGQATAVPKTEIQAARAATSDTASLLKDVPGVSLYGAGGVSSLPAIHGLADDRLRIKVDGMDLIASCPNHMNPALSYVDPTNVGSMKVYAGISPVSVGGDSIGGSIVVETPAPKFAALGQGSLFEGEVGAFYRSNGNAVGGNVSATYATESFNVTYTGATAKSDNYDAGGNFKASIYRSATYSPYETGRPGHTLPLDEVGSTAYETRNHTLGIAFRGGNHLVEAKFGYQDLPYQLYPNQRMDMLDNDQKRLNLRYLGAFDWGSLEARAYHEKVDHFMDFGDDKKYYYRGGGNPDTGGGAFCSPQSITCAWGMPMYTASKTTGVSAKADINLTQQDLLRVGAEYQRYRLDDWWPESGAGMLGADGVVDGDDAFWNINNGKRDRTALFGEWEKRFSPQVMTLLGARYERVKTDAGNVVGYNPDGGGNQGVDANAFNAKDRSKTDNNWDMTALAKYTVSPMQDIDFGFAHKTRSPNLYERYTWSTWTMAAVMNNFVGDGNGYWGDVNLKPEKANTLSATFDWHAVDRGWEFKATPYYTRVTDYIDAVQWNGNAATGTVRTTLVANQFTVLRYTNQDARLYGLDLSGKMPLGKTGVGEFGVKGLLNYTNGKNTDTGDELYNIMPLNAKLTLTHKYGGWNNAIELVMVKGKNDGSDVRNEIETSSYNLINLRGSYSWQKVRVDFGIENLFDKLYYLPTGGAYVGQGSTMSTSTTANSTPKWGTAVPGMGRSLYAGVNYKF
jgi:iron complex outermembrane receptor protein